MVITAGQQFKPWSDMEEVSEKCYPMMCHLHWGFIQTVMRKRTNQSTPNSITVWNVYLSKETEGQLMNAQSQTHIL